MASKRSSGSRRTTPPSRARGRRRAVPDPVTDYARAVVAGEIVAGKLVRLACQRHLDDLEHGAARGLTWALGEPSRLGRPAQRGTAWHALEFFGHLRHYKGKWAGQPIVLEPWQQFIVGSIFGWRRADGTRRFRIAYTEVARKGGKSTLGGGIGDYMLVADGEPGAEVYSAATKRDQAKIVWDAAAQMVKRSGLKRFVQVFKNNLSVPATASKFEPLGADEDTLDGLNPHCAIIDEFHAHKTRGLWDVLESALGARAQPLLFVITTAGFLRGVCYELRDYCVKILEGVLREPSTDSVFAYVATIDKEDRWDDPNVWVKANPNLGVSIALDYLLEKAEKAKALPAFENNFRCKHLNQWVEQAERWMPMEAWDACGHPVDVAALKGRACFGGLDLSTTTDISAFVLVFPPVEPDDRWVVLPRFWVNEERIELVRQGRLLDGVPYHVWKDQGFLEATDGNVIDYDVIRDRIIELGREYKIREIGFDSWNASQISVQLEKEGFKMVEMRQGARTLSGPMKFLHALVLDRQLAHGAHPVLRWMASNVAVKVDENENITPSKKHSTGRIDGIVATVMAIGRAQVTSEKGPSVYTKRGVLAFGG